MGCYTKFFLARETKVTLSIEVLVSTYLNSIIIPELVQYLLLETKIMGLSPQILSFTIITWGNSLSDFIVNVSKIGHAYMGLSGCYGAPVFLIYFGFGLIILMQCIKSDSKLVSILLEKSSTFILLANTTCMASYCIRNNNHIKNSIIRI
ncbi:uncharacterized protein CMU_023480 [Cryptosporidium muris RN66]|uniref:Sodium/calcium exchanger membrane region domain-containing protein n=1 Tax=Cryptosporidium muris (strain RN66) TaxID=441375 RepID=B6ABZ0_CRYMR|nr:uncharacterized protein CMU_023480 [Cryptosporidium muris RN66]EEA05343.1 hypothetical protein, conserved [Cryptosporidium muris RN66]|eukprot:XP_002139692.1 hypothetical protein [Cryptosporidium muris RN66]